eukprot:g4051.t1
MDDKTPPAKTNTHPARRKEMVIDHESMLLYHFWLFGYLLSHQTDVFAGVKESVGNIWIWRNLQRSNLHRVSRTSMRISQIF